MKSTKLKVLLPLITMGIITLSSISYGDVKVNINDDKTEGYSYNSDETVNLEVPESDDTPLYDGKDNYKSNVDKDNYNSNVDKDNYYNSYIDDEDTYYSDDSDYYNDNYSDDEYYNDTDEYYSSKNNKQNNITVAIEIAVIGCV